MNWLKTIKITDLHARFGAFKLLISLAAVLLVVIIFAYKSGNFHQKIQTKVISEQTTRLDELYGKLESAKSQINTLSVELEIERLANHKAQQSMRSIEDDHFALKKELAFYEKIMAPEKQANGVIIDELEVSATASENHYRIRVVLVQQQKSKRYAKGHIKVEFAGSLLNRPAIIKLESVSKLDKKQLSFSFQYFQVLEGEFTLPKDFIPEKIAISAIMPPGKWQKNHRLDENYPWPVKTAS
ncbi:DUF6776 family protein [Colwelliaceae bacterium BS250]